MSQESKILPKIATAMILFSILTANFSFVQAQINLDEQIDRQLAKEAEAKGASEGSKSDCSLWRLNLKICAAEALAILGNSILWFAGLFLDVTENFFNTALHQNLDPVKFDPSEQTIILDGWTILRDTANLFFIFILLVIAIAVIIGWETYSIKKALPTLIIIILLINFSLLFTRYVVEFSNGLAQYFYESLAGPYDKSQKFEMSDLFHKGLSSWDVLQAYKKEEVERKAVDNEKSKAEKEIKRLELCINPNKIIFCKGTKEELEKELADVKNRLAEIGSQKAENFTVNKENIFKTIAFSTVFGTIIVLVAAFVFLSAAILLVIRIVMLWILMIFAPIALLLWALPSTAGHGKTWLSYLFNQAFFLPVYLFFIMLVGRFVGGKDYAQETTGVISNIVRQVDPSLLSKAAGGEGFIFNFTVVIVLLLASLHFARSMASHGASKLIELGEKYGRDYALGYAGKGLAAGGRMTGRFGEWAEQNIGGRVGRITGMALKDMGKVGGGLGKGLQWAGFGKYEKSEEERELAKAKKALRGMSNEGLIKDYEEKQLYPAIRREYEKEMEQRGIAVPSHKKQSFADIMLGRLPRPKPGGIAEAKKLASLVDLDKASDASTPIQNRAVAFAGFNKEQIKNMPIQPFVEFLKNSPSDVIHMGANPEQAYAIFERGGEILDAYIAKLKQLGPTVQDIAREFDKLGNKEMATIFRTGTIKDLIEPRLK